jgi:hypothetical protein
MEAPMHRLLGPPATLMLGVVGWAVYDSHTAAFADMLGLLTVAALCFGLPLAIMRWGWLEITGKAPEQGRVVHVHVGPAQTASCTAESAA